MALKKNEKTTPAEAATESGAPQGGVVSPTADAQKQKIADAQAKIHEAKSAGATAGEAAPAPVQPEPVEQPIPEETAVVVRPPEGEITKPLGRVAKIFEDRRDIMLAPYGTFPRIKTGSGDFTDGEGTKYGAWLVFEMLSFNELFVITPNDNSKDPAVQEEVKQAVKYSYDGINLDDGTGTVAEYMATLKEAWDNPKVKNYRECVGILHGCDKAAQAEENIGAMVQLQLAPTSRAKHEGYIMASSFHVQRGVYTEDEAAVMMIKAASASGGGNNWTNFTFKKHSV